MRKLKLQMQLNLDGYVAGTDGEKIIFSKTMDRTEGKNAIVTNADVVTEVNKLKAQPGLDIMAYGGAGFASSLIDKNLIDEYHLFINPVILGNGMVIFNKLTHHLKLRR